MNLGDIGNLVTNTTITTCPATGTTTTAFKINPTTATTPNTININCKPIYYTDNTIYSDLLNIYYSDPNKHYQFQNIKEIVPEKVYEFRFAHNHKIKTIREKDDPFDFEYMFYLAIAKNLYSKEYTFEGVLAKAKELKYEKKYAKAVKDGIRLFKKLKEEEEKKKELDKTRERQHKRYVQKKQEAKRRKENKQINLIAKAIKKSKEEES